MAPKNMLKNRPTGKKDAKGRKRNFRGNPTNILNDTVLMLSGKTILVTRSKNASAEIQGLLESHGAAVICLPTIEIGEPESWKECDASIWKLAEYDSVCFTSKNAVDKFIQRVRLIRPQALNTLATRNQITRF